MAQLRYVRSPDQVKRARERNPEFLSSRVRSLRCVYETDRAIARALVPRPLELAAPEICVTFSHVAMQVTPEICIEIGSAIFGVRARYEDRDGIWLVTMPMTTEQAVVQGRETYGEPKKIADIAFEQEDDRVSARVTRLGVTYLEASGRLGAAQPATAFTERGFCCKALPACERERDFDGEPLLVELVWKHDHDRVQTLEDARLELREAPFDPVADVPVRRLLACQYEEGTTESQGRVLQPLPPEWITPVLHQRYDDVAGEGLEI